MPEVVEILFEASSDEVVHPCPPHVALAAIETSLTPKKLARFAQKEARGVDDRKDPVYSTWRYLREQANGKKGTRLEENTTTVEEHPLYKAGLIPRRLVEVFQTPPESASIPRRGRGTTKARVLTSQELSDSIKQHDLKRKMAAAQKEERKRARIDKKAMQAKETVKKRGTTRKAKSAAHLAKDVSSERMQYFNQLQDALLTCTTYAAMADMLPSKLLYSDLEVNPPSVNDAKKLRTDEVANGLLASSFKAKNLRSVHVTGDGNCFPRTGSVLCCGNEERHVEIRVKIVHELIVHSDLYLSDEFLSAGSSIANLSLKYAQYSMFYAAGRKLTSSDIRDQYEQEVMEVARRNTYCGIWQLHAMTSLLAMPVQSLYPGLGPPKADLSRLILPRVQTSDEVVHILWTSTWNTNVATWWEPNHFCARFPMQPADACAHCQPVATRSCRQPAATDGRRQPASTHSYCQPAAAYSRRQPAATHGRRQPAATHGRRQPAATHGRRQPAATHGHRQPAATHSRRQPAATCDRRQPAATCDRRQPAATHGRRQPTATHSRRQPAATHGRPQPASTHGHRQSAATHSRRQPAATHGRPKPASTHGHRQSTATHSRRQPAATHSRRQPAATCDRPQPASTHGHRQSAATHSRRQTTATHSRRQPAATCDRRQPAATHGRRQPTATHSRRQPAATHSRRQPAATHDRRQPADTNITLDPRGN